MSPVCKCPTPKPRPAGVGRVVCVTCHGKVFAKKKGEPETPAYANISDAELEKLAHDLERRQRQLQMDIQAFKATLKTRAARREQAEP